MHRYCLIAPVLTFLLAAIGPGSARAAGVIVVMNRTETAVSFLLTDADRARRRLQIEPGELSPIHVSGRVAVSFMSDGRARHYGIDPNRAYTFLERRGHLDLAVVPLAEASGTALDLPTEGQLLPPPEPLVVPVKLLVDDDEPAVQALWERRLRNRLAEASKIFEQHCGVRLEVAAVDTWHSDDRLDEFGESLAEFESKVDPAPGKLAIGFTSQYKIPPRRVPLGGIRGPLHPWILIREWSQHVTASERLEILVHELGHFLGAAHSAESDSVMRPELGDRQSHALAFRIGFDPLNTLAMNVLVAELRRGPFRGYASAGPQTRASLHQVYSTLAESLPDDPAAQRYIEFLKMESAVESNAEGTGGANDDHEARP